VGDDDGPGPRRERRLDGRRGQQQGGRVDVGEARDQPGLQRGGGGVHARVGGRDHLVAGLAAHAEERELEGVRPVGDADAVRGADGGRELLLEGVVLGAEDVPAARQDLLDGGAQRLLELEITPAEVVEGDVGHLLRGLS
jgi:hypothetical protein